ncbi:hypothetical protein [Amycolatopsis sp. WAC 04169]|uniref:hypothetical protein n=1 Tax=Amycolatopsis sp. WAC 04169 TaxID=2203197 RepID=UPI000F77E032|nr:hypothetical protein [Amycolatopsis sp. WAC 04169]
MDSVTNAHAARVGGCVVDGAEAQCEPGAAVGELGESFVDFRDLFEGCGRDAEKEQARDAAVVDEVVQATQNR